MGIIILSHTMPLGQDKIALQPKTPITWETKTRKLRVLVAFSGKSLLPQSVQMGSAVDSAVQWEKRGSVLQQFLVTQKLKMTQVQGKDKSSSLSL